MFEKITKRMRGEGGFTLIELLVVIIIIGILAAIAIPMYLSQRNKGYEANAKSDLRNAAVAEESYFTDNRAYTADLDELEVEGFTPSDGIAAAFAATVVDADTFCLEAQHEDGGAMYTYTSDDGEPVEDADGC